MLADLGEAAQPVDADTVLGLLPTPPRLLGLGEPTHGEDALLDLRNQLFRRLVEHGSYRTIALESDCLMGLVVDDYVTSGVGDLDDVMTHGISHGWGTSPANRDLVRWMRAFNADRPAADQVRFAGFDGPLEMAAAASPRGVLTALHDYLAAQVEPDRLPCTAATLDRLLGADDRWTDPAAMMDPTRSVGQTPEAGRLRLVADDLAALLDTQTPHLIARTTRSAWDRARLQARTATGLLRYHDAMADAAPKRFERLCALRDSIMAANLLALARRGTVLVHAANGHLQRDQSSMQMGGERLEWWSAGAIVSAHLGADYAFVPTAVGTIRHQGVDAPVPGTLEGALDTLPGDQYVIDPARITAALGDGPLTPRASTWFGYAPLDPAHLASCDAVVYVKHVRASTGD